MSQKIEELIRSLEKPTIAKVLRTIDLLKDFGPQLGMPHSKKIEDGLFGLRIRGKQEIRIFYCFRKNSIILLHSFIKKTQKIPEKEIRIALQAKGALDSV